MRGQATLTKDEAEKLVQAACSAMSAELARLRAELEKARAELATLDISYKEAIHSIGVDRHNAERWQSECLNAREEARRLQALIERRRIEANDTRVNAAGWEERALRAERERDEARADVATLARSYLKPYARALKEDPDVGGFTATITEFPGCYAEGETRDEALANIEESATAWMLAALSMDQTVPEPTKHRLRAELAEAERERDEAVSKIREHAEHVNYYGALYSQTELERRNIDEQREFYKDELAKAQTCADEMAALAWKWKYKADCQRATIRALVVAFRITMNAIRDYPVYVIRRRVRLAMQDHRKSDRQAGKE